MVDFVVVAQCPDQISYVFRTVRGWCGAKVTLGGLSGLVLPAGSQEEAERRVWERLCGGLLSPAEASDALRVMAQSVESQVSAYFRGERREFDLALDWSGATPFRKKVWAALCKIPYGEICSYGDIAAAVGCATARPVGQALAANPIPLVVPCHRVLDVRSRLHGFSGDGGLDMKRDLLLLEGATGWIE